MSQMEEDTAFNSCQLCCGSEVFGKFIPLKTPVRLKELLGPNAEKEFAALKLGLLAVSMGLHNPELSELSLSTDVMCASVFPWVSLLPGPVPPGLLS
jgi:hypothetical protein